MFCKHLLTNSLLDQGIKNDSPPIKVVYLCNKTFWQDVINSQL